MESELVEDEKQRSSQTKRKGFVMTSDASEPVKRTNDTSLLEEVDTGQLVHSVGFHFRWWSLFAELLSMGSRLSRDCIVPSVFLIKDHRLSLSVFPLYRPVNQHLSLSPYLKLRRAMQRVEMEC